MKRCQLLQTANFNRFMQRQPLDTSVYIPATVSQSSDTIRINANFPLIDHELKLHYLPKDSTHIWYTGDVYFDSTRVIVPNNSCNLQNPACINRLYNQTDLGAIISLKTSEQSLDVARVGSKILSTFEATQFINGILDAIKLDLEKASTPEPPKADGKSNASA